MSKNPLKKYVIICCAIAAVFCLARVYYRLTDDFRLANMTYHVPYKKEWVVNNQNVDQLKEVLQQKFFYIGKGAQSYAFASEDQQYVLKFFKFKHLKPSPISKFLPSIFPFKQLKEREATRKQKKLLSVFDGYRLGYDVHQKESGLVYMQLNPYHPQSLHLKANLKDKLGFDRTVDLNSVVFILQEKAKTTRAIIIDLLNRGQLEDAKRKVAQIFDLYMTEYQKGIYDRDHGVMHNTGFVGDRPIHLDIGKLTKDERMKTKEFYRPDLIKIATKFQVWFKANYPREYPELVQFMEGELQRHLEEKVSLSS